MTKLAIGNRVKWISDNERKHYGKIINIDEDVICSYHVAWDIGTHSWCAKEQLIKLDEGNKTIKAHQKLGPVSRQLCMLFDGLVVGGGVKYLVDETGQVEKPRDIDIVVPIDRWVQASKLIPPGAAANSFGGFKFMDGELEVDVWADDACRIFWMNRSISFYCLRNGYYVVQS